MGRLTLPKIPSPSWLRWTFVAVLGWGVLGLAGEAVRESRKVEICYARGPFWTAADATGKTLQVRQSGNLLLHKKENIRLFDEESDRTQLNSFSLIVRREMEPSEIEIALGKGRKKSLVLRIAPLAGQGIRLLGRKGEGELQTLARREDRDYVGEPKQWIRVEFLRRKGRVGLKINNKNILQAEHSASPGEILSLIASTGPLRLMEMEVKGTRMDSAGTSKTFSYKENFRTLPSANPWWKKHGFLLGAFLFLVALLFFLRSLCLRRPGWLRLIQAEALCLVPVSLYFGFGLFKPVSPFSLIVLAAFLLGMIPALFHLREALKEDAKEGPVGRIGSGLSALLIVVIASCTGGTYSRSFYEPALKAERNAQKQPPPRTFRWDGVDGLGPHNAKTVKGDWRHFDLKASITLEQDSILEIRMRTPDPETLIGGISLFLSSDPRFEPCFYLATMDEFKPLGAGSTPLPANVPLDVLIQARGREFEARINGRPIASAQERLFAAGSFVLATARGRAELKGLEIQAPSFEEGKVSALPDWLTGAAPLPAVLLVYALIVTLFTGKRFWRALEAGAYGLLPLAYGFLHLSPSERVDLNLVVGAIFASALLFLCFPLIHVRSWKIAKILVLLLLLLGGSTLAFMEARKRSWPADMIRANSLQVSNWSGDRLEKDFLHFQHPLYRRFNSYLAQHKFRSGFHELEKEEGMTRIIALGTSSTYGYKVKIPYPKRLEMLMRSKGYSVEVINAAYNGSDGLRLYYLFKNALLEFEPDIVTLNLFYNDSFAYTQLDHVAYLEKITAPSYSRSPLDVLRDEIMIRMGGQRRKVLMQAFRDPTKPSLFDGASASPPARFEEVLRSYALLAKEQGIRLMLVKEPLKGNMDFPCKAEFYEAIDRVGDEFDLIVVDPSPLLEKRGGSRLFMDNVHPYDKGNAVIAEALFTHIGKFLEAP